MGTTSSTGNLHAAQTFILRDTFSRKTLLEQKPLSRDDKQQLSDGKVQQVGSALRQVEMRYDVRSRVSFYGN